MQNLKYLLFLLICLGGCSDHRHPSPSGDIVAPGVKVIGYDGSIQDRGEQREATEVHTSMFSQIASLRVPKTDILYLKNEEKVFELCQFQGASGCVIDFYEFPPTEVVVWAGEFNECPALPHEMVHLVIGDPTHSDPRWHGPLGWDQKFGVISSQIRDSRK